MRRGRGRGRGRATSSSTSISSSCSCSSSFDTSNNPASSFTHSQFKRDLSTDLRLGLSISPSSVSQQHNVPSGARSKQSESESDSLYSIKSLNPAPEEAMNLYAAGLADEDCNDPDHGHSNSTTMYVKVYMEGHGIGRKLDLLAHDGFHELIQTLGHMFNTNILWGDEVDRVHSAGHDVHVLTYEDEEGDWLMVGDVPWEMFLSTAKRLKITRTFPC